jgi:SWI/SNF-related matrix-associated actin-dependent regulator of chromatin subfamily A-like protein 1
MSSITVTQEGGKFIARFPFDYATKDLVKAAGFRFDPVRKYWWTGDASIAAQLGKDPSELAANLTAQRQAKHDRDAAAIEASRAADADVDIPAPEGCKYDPYQRAAVAYAMNRPSVLIGDEMGLGKTIEALGIINADPSIKSVLIICPATPKLNWKREAQKWLVRPMTVGVANGVFPATDVVIIN